MNANTSVRKALRSHLACHSFRGHDFAEVADRRYVKKVTNRARRALDKALVRNGEG